MMKKTYSWTVLVYTLVLVLLWVFMALATLNLTFKLEADYKVRQLDLFFSDTIRSKSHLLLKYWRSLNSDGGWFTDAIWCPQNISFSGATLASTTWSVLRFQDNIFFCEWEHAGTNFQIYFNTDFDDTVFLDYSGSQIPFSALNQTGILSDSDTTFVDGSASFPLLSDQIDDNFNSDNYKISASGSVLYPDAYRDNDVDHRLMQFSYIAPWSDWYNIYWINDRVRDYITSNTNNISPLVTLPDVSDGHLYLSVNTDYDIRIIRFERNAYTQFNELRILEDRESSGTAASWVWYLQADLSLAEVITYGPDGSTVLSRSPTGSEFSFDFANNDYAIFLRNRSSDTVLLSQLSVFTGSWSEVYAVAIRDDEPAILSMLWNHIIFSETWIPIGEQLEILQLK